MWLRPRDPELLNRRLAITLLVVGSSVLMAEDSNKPSPFPDKRAKEEARKRTEANAKRAAQAKLNRAKEQTGTADRQAQTGSSAMGGTATFFRLKDQNSNTEPMTAAHTSLPIGSSVRVVNEANGSSVTVRITSRLPGGNGTVISLSQPAAERLGFTRAGTAQVRLERLQSSAAQ